MRVLYSAALAASLLAVPALAATPPSNTSTQDTAPAPAAQTGAPPAAAQTGAPAAGAATAAQAGVNANATVGMSVQDNTGATIGKITALAPDATGKTMATIQMGTQKFAVDASALAVQGNAATINTTKADIVKQLPKSQ